MTSSSSATCLLAALLFAACAAPRFPALAVDGLTPLEFADVFDTELFDVLRVGQPAVVRDEAGRLSMRVPVLSLDDEPLDVIATVRFFDATGQLLGRGVQRQKLRLLPGLATDCAASTADIEAVAWRIEFAWDRW